METAILSLEESIKNLLEEKPKIELPGSIEDYFDLLQDNEAYDIEYFDHIITAKMSSASDEHELLVMNIGSLLVQAFKSKKEYRVYGSNRPIYIPDQEAGYNADVLVVKGPTKLYPRDRAIAATTNPRIIIEVLSNSNKGKHFDDKLSNYKKIASLNQIILINQYRPYVSVYTRTPDDHVWINQDYDNLEMAAQIEDFEISLKEIYQNLFE